MKKIILAIITLTVLVGCGDRVTTAPGRVSKVLGTDGLEKTIRKEGSFRLAACPFSACQKLVVLDVFENTKTIESKYYISSSKLNLTLGVDIQYFVRLDDASINKIFQRVKSVKEGDYLVITTDRVFDTYISPIDIDTIRTALNTYDIDTIMDNLSKVRKTTETAMKNELKNSPVGINSLTFSKVSYPDVIVTRREEEASVEAEKATKLKRLESDLIVAKERRKLMIERAKNAVAADKIVSQAMDKKMATWLIMDAIQTCAERTVGDCNIDIHPSLIPQL